ncbi:MAG: DUF190 domain-containing protein [Candidatus Binatia bacterium]|nr:DUF190 domain-containing protein [Candidatus Binatia bacterium]
MVKSEEGCALRIYIADSDREGGKPVYEAIVQKAEELGLAGATVHRASMGFGPKHHLVAAKVLRLSADLPVVVEVIDTRAQIDTLLPHLEKLIANGISTLEPVELMRYSAD